MKNKTRKTKNNLPMQSKWSGTGVRKLQKEFPNYEFNDGLTFF